MLNTSIRRRCSGVVVRVTIAVSRSTLSSFRTWACSCTEGTNLACVTHVSRIRTISRGACRCCTSSSITKAWSITSTAAIRITCWTGRWHEDIVRCTCSIALAGYCASYVNAAIRVTRSADAAVNNCGRVAGGARSRSGALRTGTWTSFTDAWGTFEIWCFTSSIASASDSAGTCNSAVWITSSIVWTTATTWFPANLPSVGKFLDAVAPATVVTHVVRCAVDAVTSTTWSAATILLPVHPEWLAAFHAASFLVASEFHTTFITFPTFSKM
jgi:hypothetical protein